MTEINYQKTWGIVGLGWLGQSLYKKLQSQGLKVWGTHRAEFDWRIHEFPEKACDVLFLNTPPLTDISPEDYVRKIHRRDKIIFISSISVYGDQSGTLTETDFAIPKTASGKWLLAVEQLLIEKFPNEITIIRPGGLIGGSRHPAIHLSKSQSPCSADTPINLIHREDLVRIICRTSTVSKPLKILNAVAPFHPRKEDYYSAWTKKLDLAPINFIKVNEAHKIVESQYLREVYPDWVHPQIDSL
ncbi:SDR family NAD(P)-dependent oxidoreductase [Bdellovibrio bacteriovorus]